MKSQIRAVRKNGRLNLFFVEMIIVLLFFSIAAAVVLRSFAGSYKLAKESRETEKMAFLSQSAAEIYSETASLSETAEMLLSDRSFKAQQELSKVTFPMDGGITVTLSESSEEYDGGTLKTLKIVFQSGSGEVLYETESGAYVPERTVDKLG